MKITDKLSTDRTATHTCLGKMLERGAAMDPWRLRRVFLVSVAKSYGWPVTERQAMLPEPKAPETV